MKAAPGNCLAAFLWLVSGEAVALGPGDSRFTEILNRLENFNASVCQIDFNQSYTCSGVLLNNSREPGSPLILTAAHCLENEQDLDFAVVTFGKRKLLKDQAYAGLEWSSTGLALLSSSREIDFALLKLRSKIPGRVSPVFLGWKNGASQAEWVASIHSPDFGEIQYSFSLAKPSLATFGGLYDAIDSGHWEVNEWTRGTTTLGSSGAPLLDPDFGIIGGLSGSTDWENHKSDYFFRFDLAYDHFSDPAMQLKAWIDPDDSGSQGPFRPNHKIRNYRFTSRVSETEKLVKGSVITEEFSLDEGSRINGVYVLVGELNKGSEASIEVMLSHSGSQVYAERISTSGFVRYSENYIPLSMQPVVGGKISISIKFNAKDSADYITIPKTRKSSLTSYFLALNSSRP